MIDAADVSAGRRRAALTLHALAAPDRDWLLAQLPEEERTTLRGLLDELQTLGIPADTGVIRAALAEAASAAASSFPHAQALAEVLGREAEALRGPLLSLLPAKQQEALRACWPPLQAPPAQVAKPSWTPRLQEALLKSWLELAGALEARP